MRTLQKMRAIRYFAAFSFIFLFHSLVWAQEKANDKPPLSSKTFESEFSLVWDGVLETLKRIDFSLKKSDKKLGKITTKTKRYFRIFSAEFPPCSEIIETPMKSFSSKWKIKKPGLKLKGNSRFTTIKKGNGSKEIPKRKRQD